MKNAIMFIATLVIQGCSNGSAVPPPAIADAAVKLPPEVVEALNKGAAAQEKIAQHSEKVSAALVKQIDKTDADRARDQADAVEALFGGLEKTRPKILNVLGATDKEALMKEQLEQQRQQAELLDQRLQEQMNALERQRQAELAVGRKNVEALTQKVDEVKAAQDDLKKEVKAARRDLDKKDCSPLSIGDGPALPPLPTVTSEPKVPVTEVLLVRPVFDACGRIIDLRTEWKTK